MARRRRLARPLYFLALLLVAIYAAVGVGVASGDSDTPGGASFTPNLALDLEGGTQLILTPRTDDGHAVTQDDIDQAIAIIRQRVDGSGVAEAEITSQGGSNIVVAIPGEVSNETVDLITASAQMRMRPVLIESGPGPIDPSILAPQQQAEEAEEESATEDEAATEDEDPATTEDATAPAELPVIESTPENIEAAALLAIGAESVADLSDTPETEPTDPSDLAWLTPQVLFDYYTLDCTDPTNLTGTQDDATDKPFVTCSPTGNAKYVLGPAELTGQDLASAEWGFQPLQSGGTTNIPIVRMNFTSAGAAAFTDVTARIKLLQPPQNQFAIVLDGLVISAPRVQDTIAGGSATIEGPSADPFTRTEAETLANQLNFGSLPLTFEVQSQEQISATLGTEQLQRGLLAGALGLLLVVAYSFFTYRGLAIVTVASLTIAALLTYGVILVLSWTQGYRLSLAGVAGLIVAIGVTADSFIVYFERLRDEVREGRSLQGAVEHGWVRARRTIVASDTVNFIAAIVLYLLAVGGVRGFAFTLGLTTLVDLVVVFLFTHPLMRLLIKIPFFGDGHKWSGLDPVRLGASVASYAGRGRVRSAPEKTAVIAGADTRTLAERRADAERAAREEQLRANEEEFKASQRAHVAAKERAERDFKAEQAQARGGVAHGAAARADAEEIMSPVVAPGEVDPSETWSDAIDSSIAMHSPAMEALADGVVLTGDTPDDENEETR